MLNVIPLPALADNYIWVIHDQQDALVIDPGDARVVHDYLAARQLQLRGILVTHRHADHVSGIANLLAPGQLPVWGPENEPIPGRNQIATDGDLLTFSAPQVALRVIATPGHTAGHVSYYGANHLFCGDTLFAGGCGRIFDGTAVAFHASLQRISILPDDTKICCAHEYTAANLRFGHAVEPHNTALIARIEAVAQLRAAGLPSLPSQLREERATNPFLRLDCVDVQEYIKRHSPTTKTEGVSLFSALRQIKDQFR
jgi:hydroxyacylglutathione hydrolase